MTRRREYETEVRAVISGNDTETLVSLRGPEASGSVSLPQPKETVKPGTIVRITVESGRD